MMFFLINARASSGAEGVGKQLYCVQCSDSGMANSPTRQGSAENDKIVHKMSGMEFFCLLICNHNREVLPSWQTSKEK